MRLRLICNSFLRITTITFAVVSVILTCIIIFTDAGKVYQDDTPSMAMSVIFGALALVAAALTFINIKYTCGKITEKNAIQEINRIKITNVVLALCMPYVLIFMFDVFMKRSDLSPAIIIFHVLAIYLSIISFIMNVVFSRRISRFCKAAKRYYSNLNLSKKQLKKQPLGEFYVKLDKSEISKIYGESSEKAEETSIEV